MNPQIQDVAIAQARVLMGADADVEPHAARRSDSAPTNVFAGGLDKITDSRMSDLGSASTRCCRPARTTRSPGTTHDSTSSNFFNTFDPLFCSNVTLRLHPAAAPQFQDRQRAAAARDQPQGSRERPTSAAVDDRPDRRATSRTRTGIWRSDRQPECAAAVARPGEAAPGRQREAGADRHDGADRHRRGAVGGRAQRRVGDRRRGGDQAGGRSAARADLRSGGARLLDDRPSSRAMRRRFRRRRSTPKAPSAVRSTTAPTCSRRKTAWNGTTSASATSATRCCPTSTPT